MTTQPESTPEPLSRTIVPSQQPGAPPPRIFRIVKRAAIVLWVFFALVIPCFFPFISPEPQRWWKFAGVILFGLSWSVLFCGVYVAILDDGAADSPPQAKFAKGIVIGFLRAH